MHDPAGQAAGTSPVEPALVREILRGYALSPHGIHGPAHWGRVLEHGLFLAARTGADAAVVAHFAVFHDVRRVNDGSDPGHGRRGAALARALRARLPLDPAQLDLLAWACEHHTDREADDDVTVQACWEADRLDLWRVGYEPSAPWLRSAAALDPATLAWTRERSLARHVPGFVTRHWLAGAAPA